jgi:hypothetical protein
MNYLTDVYYDTNYSIIFPSLILSSFPLRTTDQKGPRGSAHCDARVWVISLLKTVTNTRGWHLPNDSSNFQLEPHIVDVISSIKIPHSLSASACCITRITYCFETCFNCLTPSHCSTSHNVHLLLLCYQQQIRGHTTCIDVS